LALLALVATALLTAAVLAFVVGNGAWVIAGVAGLAITIWGGWWAVVGRRAWRWLGMGAAAGGAALLIVTLFAAGGANGHTVGRVVVTLGLAAVAVISARAAFAMEVRASVRGPLHTVTAPRRPVLLCNPWSGGGKVQRFGLVELASSLGIETVLLDHGLDLEVLARQAIARGADCLGMAGGDGSQALVASIAVEHDLPFVCVSAGTRNHFALDLGLDRDDPRASVHAFVDAVERRVDYATVNDRFFVNNVSLGVYATIVQQEGYRDAKAETTRALLPELLGRTDTPFDLQFFTPDGSEVDGAFLVMVSNNPYVLGPALDVGQRRRLDAGELGVFAVSAATGAEAAQVMTLALAGRAASGGHAYTFTASEFEVRSRSGKAYAGIDGEALELDTPLRFAVHPRGLRLLVPAGNLGVAARRRAREVRLKDLVAIVAGRPRSPSAG
jgi:diacylglycerol kinase family enzyme